jgi:hypothetical protein
LDDPAERRHPRLLVALALFPLEIRDLFGLVLDAVLLL